MSGLYSSTGDPSKGGNLQNDNVDAANDTKATAVNGNIVGKVLEGFTDLPHEFILILSLLSMFCLVMQWSPPKPKDDEDDEVWHTVRSIPMGIGFGVVGALFLQWTKGANESCTSVVILAVLAALYAGVAWDSFLDNFKIYFTGGIVFFMLLLLSVVDKTGDKMKAGLALVFILFFAGSVMTNIYELIQLKDDDERNTTMSTPIRVVYLIFLFMIATYYYYFMYDKKDKSFGQGFEYGDTIMNSYEL